MKVQKSKLEQVYQLGLILISELNKYLGKSEDFKPCILCYHAVGDNDWEFSTKICDFKKQIDYLKKTRSIVPLPEILNLRNKNKVKQVAITFDDGYESLFKNVLPVLKKHNILAAVFVVGDTKNAVRKELGANEKLLSIKQIKELHKSGWEIGFHSKTHAYFRQLSKEELLEEAVEGKKELEKKLGFKLRCFAYPKGIYSKKITEIVKKAGFKTAFTVDGGAVNKNSDNYHIKRIIIDGNRNIKQFSAMLSTLGLFLGQMRISVFKTQDYLRYKIQKTQPDY